MKSITLWLAFVFTSIFSCVEARELIGARNYLLTFWGDSLTAGTGSSGVSTQYPYVVANSGPSGRWYFQGGVGGQTSTQIGVRQGGIVTTATVVGGQIPASGGVTVTFPVGYEPVTSQGPSVGVLGTISGVYGTVTLSGGTYTFTRSVAGSVVNVSSAQFVVDNGNRNSGTVPIWAGRNNFSQPATVESDVAAMVASVQSQLGHPLVLSIINGQNDMIGSGNYTNIVAINASFAASYGSSYVDVRSPLVAAYNPANGVDVIDHAGDTVPYTLRAQNINGALVGAIGPSDTSFSTNVTFSTGYVLLIDSEYILVNSVSGTTVTSSSRGYGGSTPASHSNGSSVAGTDPVHLNDAGYAAVANIVYNAIAANGW